MCRALPRRRRLCDLEALEHGYLGEIENECKAHCRKQNSSHGEYGKGSHGNSANRQCRCDQQIGDRRPDEPPAWSAGTKALAFTIRVGCGLVAKAMTTKE